MGLGTQLLAKAEIELQSISTSVEYFFLHVRKKNKEAIKFYNKIGFVKDKKIKKYYPDDDALLMKKFII